LKLHQSRTISKIKYRIRLFLPPKIWRIMSGIVKKSREYEFSEHKVNYGKLNKDKKIFIIRRRPPGAGLFSNVNHAMQGVIRAKELGAIPVVDYENYWMDEYSVSKPINGSKNSWEYFFKPISNISLSEAYSSQNVILSSGQRILSEDKFSSKSYKWLFDEQKLTLISHNASNVLKLNDTLEKELMEYKSKNHVEDFNILAVSFRGGNYEKYQYAKHAKQPEKDLVREKIDFVIKNYNVDKIYVQTHDYMKFQELKELYGDKILPNISLNIYRSFEHWRQESPKDRPNHWDNAPKQTVLANQNYAKEIFLMSECSYLVASISGGSVYSVVLNNGRYVYKHIFELGEY